jgi:hypothetical protein
VKGEKECHNVCIPDIRFRQINYAFNGDRPVYY